MWAQQCRLLVGWQLKEHLKHIFASGQHFRCTLSCSSSGEWAADLTKDIVYTVVEECEWDVLMHLWLHHPDKKQSPKKTWLIKLGNEPNSDLCVSLDHDFNIHTWIWHMDSLDSCPPAPGHEKLLCDRRNVSQSLNFCLDLDDYPFRTKQVSGMIVSLVWHYVKWPVTE